MKTLPKNQTLYETFSKNQTFCEVFYDLILRIENADQRRSGMVAVP